MEKCTGKMISFIAFLYFWLTFSGGSCLKIKNLSIPGLIDVRQTAILTCDFELENSNLYSVKWYKNDLEFYRFMPDGNPSMQIFNVNGVHLDVDSCNVTTVVLNPLEFETSGLYVCEVSTEAPYFKTVHMAANITVWGIPEKNPAITGIENIYAVGDYVEGNCTSDFSHPLSEMDWYINGNQVESWQLERYPAAGDFDDSFLLKRSVLGVSFQVDHSHFSGEGNTMVLKCVARVNNVSKEALRISKLADLTVEKFAQGLYDNRGSFTVGNRYFYLFTCILSIACASCVL